MGKGYEVGCVGFNSCEMFFMLQVAFGGWVLFFVGDGLCDFDACGGKIVPDVEQDGGF